MNPSSLADTNARESGDGETAPTIAIIIPACNEAPCIARVLAELLSVIDPAKYIVGVGVNGAVDRTAELAREYPVIVAETSERGYGFGCQAAIEAVNRAQPTVEAYIFFAADGASDPCDVSKLGAAFGQGYSMVLGARTTSRRNWATMSLSHVLANFALGLWCGLLTRRWFTDLAPHRLIARDLFEAMALREMTFGWTIEAQIAAAMLGARVIEVPAHERKRIAGEQKVSGVTWARTFRIGCRIVAAGWRTRLRLRTAVDQSDSQPAAKFLAQSTRGV